MKASTPINIEKLEHELQNHPDINFRSYLINGLRNGFDSMVKYDTWDTKVCKNNYSARSQSTVVSDLIKKECEKGFVYGPFQHSPFPRFRVSPLGVATGKYSDKKRLILDLSSPHNDECMSVNDMIDKSDFKWKAMYYFYVRLTFGCRSSPKIFDTVSQAVCYIAEKNYKVQHILHLLDDFLTIDHDGIPTKMERGQWQL
ncbi:Hypothetical predicted protein [Mytilus galloprovincialis]|uniref:Reverse transcriptase domain-containing protein n=1 Tax=Mytilus galloprovincialis TaxID=29158 RepID=A0A8B6BQH1_MYTGA|nr:Hypothetical predicted protein [Mytilus galloprovincialis]